MCTNLNRRHSLLGAFLEGLKKRFVLKVQETWIHVEDVRTLCVRNDNTRQDAALRNGYIYGKILECAGDIKRAPAAATSATFTGCLLSTSCCP